MKGTPCSKAIQNWEAANNGASAAEAEVVKLIFQVNKIMKNDCQIIYIKIKIFKFIDASY